MMTTARAQREPSIDPTDEYKQFIASLEAFHKQRGTSFEPAPKVGNRRVDLLRLYQRVTAAGGYDIVSDRKQGKLAWRRLGEYFQLTTPTITTLAFTLKTVYYKYLAAYEIVHFHHRVPPPKEILEHVSAKGGDLLSRTAENYRRPMTRDELLANGADPEGSEDEGHTPSAVALPEPMEIDEPGSVGRRNLRQQPTPRIPFVPETGSSRGTPGQVLRHYSSQPSPSPQTGAHSMTNGLSNYSVPAAILNGYEPKQQLPLTLRPVTTPGNNPEQFKAHQKALRDTLLANRSRAPPPTRGMMLPGTGFNGPNIYIRTLLSLQSGVLEEQEYALHHLVKISHERGDKYRFDSFPGLADALIETVLGVGSLLGESNWHVVYRDHDLNNRDVLNGLGGTEDLKNKIEETTPHAQPDKMEPELFSRHLSLINEAGLVLRNMAMQEENAEYLSKLPPMRDTLIILLNLPKSPSTVEIQQYGLEMTEQLTKYYMTSPEEALFTSLLAFINSDDRGVILTSLRAISRFSTHQGQTVRLRNIPISTIERLCEWLLVEDEELRGACLDFLYHYTSVVENVNILLQSISVQALVVQLVRLLLYNGRHVEHQVPRPDATKEVNIPLVPTPKTNTISESEPLVPRIPHSLIESLLGYDEPERSSQWLRACFEESATGEITQIALWQAYQIPFAPYAMQRPLLPAKDFITNVSTTFTTASAQVMNGPIPRFVIKGIKARRIPVDPKGVEYMECLWHMDDGSECGEFALRAKDMWEHVVASHLGLAKDSQGKYDFTSIDSRIYACRWSGCKKFSNHDATSPFAVGMHLKTHLPDTSDRAYQRSKHNKTDACYPTPSSRVTTWSTRNTATDERADAAGLPLTSVLVLRNLVRQIPLTEAASTASAQGEEQLAWQIFAPVKEQLFFVMAYNRSLRDYLPVLTRAFDLRTKPETTDE